jgi:bis(5'-nucleosidyl)-tetraphosphatase
VEKKLALSAGIVPIFKDKKPLYLLLRVYNYWDFPKGIVEKGEDPKQAARRELKEETTLEEVDFTWGENFIETKPYSYGKIARYYLGQVNSREVDLPINPQLGRAEHQEYRWVTYEEAQKLLVPRVREVLNWAHNQLTSQLSSDKV